VRNGFLRWTLVLVLLVVQGCVPRLQTPSNARPAAPPQPPSQSETRTLLEADRFAELDRRFSAIQQSYKSGSLTDVELRDAFRVFYPTDAALEPKYTAWIAQFPKSYVAHLARAIYYKKLGQESRGTDSIANTTDEQVRGMKAAFAKALSDLHASVKLDDKPLLTYLHELDINSYEGDAERNRKLLDAALSIDPRDIIAREKYMGTLEPRWGGSLRQMHEFLEESKQAGISAEHLRSLEGMIFEDQAKTEDEEGDYADADRDYREALARGRSSCQPCFAYVLMKEAKFADAIPEYSKILASDPNDANALANRGQAYMETRKLREALADWTAGAALGDASSENGLGVLNMQGVPGIMLPDPQAGVNWFRKAAAQGDARGIRNLNTALATQPPATGAR
jgi:tetratricopeptide (TPR) repeat protein